MPWKSFPIVFCISTLLTFADSLNCYQCADSRVGGACQEDASGMIETHEAINETNGTYTCADIGKCRYFKSCNNTTHSYCITEKLEEQGQIHAYVRECSDGLPTLDKNLSAFHGLEPNNYTTCVIYSQKLIYCVTLCDTNMCNGPQKPKSDGTSCSVITSAQALMMICMSILTRHILQTV